jgi:hypothetical protein
VIVKLVGVPLLHDTPLFVYTGVTVIVAVTGTVPVFVPVKLDIFPVPLDASPIEGMLFAHV